MLEDADVPKSPAWWFKVMANQLQDRRHGRVAGRVWTRSLLEPCRQRPPLDLLADHLAGDPPLQGCADGWRDQFREIARLGRLNVAALIVEAKSNRMALRDFKTAAADDELGDEKARDIMRANNLRVKAREVHTGMLALADGYAMVTPQAKNEKYPTITAEDARECITAEDPATGQTLVGLKLFRDEYDSADIGHLFLRDDQGRVWHHKAIKRGGTSSLTNTGRFYLSNKWEWDGEPERVPHDQMPIVRFPNKDHVGEFERHLDTLDRINDQVLNKLVIAKMQAFRQRAIKGLPDTRKQVVDGKMTDVPIDYGSAFIAGPGELWKMPAEAELWESQVVDFRPILESIKDDLEHLAAVTSTPLHIITPDAATGSAEGASLQREQHVYAVEACIDHVDRPWAQVMATCFAFMGDAERANPERLEAIWGPVERFSLAERADAAAKAVGTLPREAIQRDIWQYPPAEIANLRIMTGRDFLTAGPAAAPAAQPSTDTGATPTLPTIKPTTPPEVTGGAVPPAAS